MSIDINSVAQIGAEFEQWNKNVAQASVNTEENQQANQEPITFDFQKEGAYSSGLINLATSQIFDMDKDGNSTVSLDEYINSGLKLYDGILDSDTLNYLVESGTIEGEFYSIDYNIDDEVEMPELALLYSLADESLEGEAAQRIKDGKFSQEDMQQAVETLFNMLLEENPEMEEQLGTRLDEVFKNLSISNILNDYDYNKNGEISDAEFVTLKTLNTDEEKLPEAKADAYVTYELIDQVMGDGNGVISEDEIGTLTDHANSKGMSIEEYSNWLIEENFKAENADEGNRQYYSEILNQFK